MPDFQPPPAALAAAKAPGKFSFILRAFASRNYRLFFAGQFLSLIGTWLTNVATSWLINRITDDPHESPRVLGYVSFAAFIPATILAPLAGVMVDRWNRHRILLWTQSLSMLQSFALAAVAFFATSHDVKPPPAMVAVIIGWLIALVMFQGLVNAVDVPARQSFVIQLVERREDLPNAIALNSSMFNSARLIGPAIAGILIWKVGEGWCFTIDGFSYLAVLVALLMMRLPPGESRPRRHVLLELREGVSYAARSPAIASMLLLLAAVSFVTTSVSILMPRFVTEILHGDARIQGLLTSAIAVGALAGALRLAARRSVVGLAGQMPMVTAILGAGMILFGYSQNLALSAVGLAVVGFGTMTQMASSNTLLQTLVDDHMRGRVMSLFAMAFMGMTPIGALAAGQLAAHIGAPRTVMIAGATAMLAGTLFATRLPSMRREMRPIYIKKGILPPPER